MAETRKKYAKITPAVGRGEGVTVALTASGSVVTTGRTLSVSASYAGKAGPENVTGLTVTAASSTVINVTIPGASTLQVEVADDDASLTADAQPTTPLYVEVWDTTTAGSYRVLARFYVEIYQPVREVT